MVTERIAARRLPQYVTLADTHRMLAACTCDRDRLLIEFLWHTGARVSEVIAVRVGDLTDHGVRLPNLKQGRWRTVNGVRQHVAVKEEKHVLLPRPYLDRLRALAKGKTPGEVLIGHLADGKPLTRKRVWEIVSRAAAAAGVVKRRFGDGKLRPAWTHLLRHGYAVNLLEHNVPITVVQDQLGHKSLSSTQVYTQIVDPRKEELIAEVRF